MKKALFTLSFILFFILRSFSQTTLTEDANGVLNTGKVVTQTSSGQIFFTGHQIGSTYSFISPIFQAITDNTGGANYFYGGISGSNTTFSVRSDGQGYFATNIGIGTANPKANLHVVGTGIFSGGNIDPNNAIGNLNYMANSSQLLIGWNRTGGAGEADFIANQGGGSAGGFAFYNHDNNNTETQLMWVTGNGQVLIGNTQGKQGSYLLAVAGSAVATSFTVKTVANWPDYVFKKNYSLLPLGDVKTFIEQNHHLPEVPSEQEMKEKGVDLGEMNKLLMKKVEELTLYLIEQNKRIEKLEEQVKDKNQ